MRVLLSFEVDVDGEDFYNVKSSIEEELSYSAMFKDVDNLEIDEIGD